MHGARLHKTSRRDAMARDPRRDRDETLVRLETVSRPRRLDLDHIPVPQLLEVDQHKYKDTIAVILLVFNLARRTTQSGHHFVDG